MSVNFFKFIEHNEYLDPRSGFENVKIPVETRQDPITKEFSRIMPIKDYKLLETNLAEIAERSKQFFCPFCPDNLEKTTPCFIKEIAPEGRIRFGNSVVIPNLFPYDLHNGVVIMTPDHFVPMDNFPSSVISESINAAFEYLRRIQKYDPEGSLFPSINWNYMPTSGGSIVHPHLHVLAGPTPSSKIENEIHATKEYYRLHNSNIWRDFVNKEKLLDERYIGNTGKIHWMTSFASRSLYDISVVFEGYKTVDDFDDDLISDFCHTLQKIFKFLADANCPSFNMALFFGGKQLKNYWAHARILSRFNLPPMGGSDINYLQMLHDDHWTVYYPEDIASTLKEIL